MRLNLHQEDKSLSASDWKQTAFELYVQRQIHCEESEEMDKWEERKKKLPNVPACNKESSINDNKS